MPHQGYVWYGMSLFCYNTISCPKHIPARLLLKFPQPLNNLDLADQHNMHHLGNIPVFVVQLEGLAGIAVLMDGHGEQTVVDELLIQDHTPGTAGAVCKGMDVFKVQVRTDRLLDHACKVIGLEVHLLQECAHQLGNLLGSRGKIHRLKLNSNAQGDGPIFSRNTVDYAVI